MVHVAPAFDRTTFHHLRQRFALRVAALVYTRLVLMVVAVPVLLIPSWRAALGIPALRLVVGYVSLLLSHAASYVWGKRRGTPHVIFLSLCVDLCVLIYAVLVSGGMKSPLMPTQLVLTMLFALLFPAPPAIVPPLLTLPIVAVFDQGRGVSALPGDALVLLWYAALNLAVVYLVVYLDSREQVALAEVVRLQRERGQRALAHQRSSIARDIHDGVGAALSGILLQTEYLSGRVAESELRRELEELRLSASEGIDELRRAVSLLRHEFQLAVAVQSYVSTFASRHRLELRCHVDGPERELAAELALAFFRTLQEALTNVAVHSQAQQVEVVLAFEPQGLRLGVKDDGVGFDPQRALLGHYGLRNMSERLRRVGGTVEVHSRPGAGTQLEASAPYGANAPHGEQLQLTD